MCVDSPGLSATESHEHRSPRVIGPGTSARGAKVTGVYRDHPKFFPPPSNPDVPIWRYMDLAKFVSLLQDKALHFSRIDRQDDNYEGSITRAMVVERRQKWAYMSDDEYARAFPPPKPGSQEALFQWVYVNCWHMNEVESAGMWSLYQSGQLQGIALRSTFRRLAESITDDETIYITEVKYIDYERETIPDAPFKRYVHKRRSFEHERELRALYIADRHKSVPVPKEEIEPNAKWHSVFKTAEVDPPDPNGVKIATDLNKLIEKVYVSPKSKPWFKELVANLIRQYGRDWGEVQHSDLDADPVY